MSTLVKNPSQTTRKKHEKLKSGTRFGRLTTTGNFTYKGKAIYYEVICDCNTKKYVAVGSLRNGCCKSCGCLNIDMVIARSKTHGMAKSKEYKAWAGAKERVTNNNSHNWQEYGGRGITMCQEWQDSFESFYNYMLENHGKHPGKGYSIDRIDNEGNYEPGNVRWANSRTQTLNSRHSKRLTFKGKTQSMIDWSKELGINYRTLSSRINIYNWSVERALTLGGKYDTARHS